MEERAAMTKVKPSTPLSTCVFVPDICAHHYIYFFFFPLRSVGDKTHGREQHQQREVLEKCFTGAGHVHGFPRGPVCL